jgi:fructose-bisphosphate aldolase class I
MGARFAKWRAVIEIGDGMPTTTCLEVNAHALARYAALCQDVGIVPIVEPEVLMDGAHPLERCVEVTTETLRTVFRHLDIQGVLLEGMLLKPNMVVPGLRAPTQVGADVVADATVTCFLRTVPAAVPGIAFLSGGQPAKAASERLDAINRVHGSVLPWPITFSYSRAIQQPALEAWGGRSENVSAAQKALVHRAACNRAARQGVYDASRD